MRVCVFGSASASTNSSFLVASKQLGALLAQQGELCINGGGDTGCMGALNRGCVENNGRVIGVIHAKWIGEEVSLVICSFSLHITKILLQDMKGIEMIVVEGEDLQERKRMMMEGADCLISLPGGVGTLDELFEAIANVHCGLSRLPICLINVDNYYEGTLLQLERAKADGLLKSTTDLFHVAKSPEVSGPAII
jgi:uncharacterized protein (TIGR00730 family)